MLSRSAFVLLLAFTGLAHAEEAIRTKPVVFPPEQNSTTIKGAIKGRESISYSFGAEAGQNFSVMLRAKNRSTSFNLYAPGKQPGDEAFVIGDQNDNRFSGALTQSGTYTINVFLIRAAARRNERSDFVLELALNGALIKGDVKADFADGLQGGPDFWAVQTSTNQAQPLYREPSTKSATLSRFANGVVMRNRGCRMVQGERWCRVEASNDATLQGWMRGAVLRESGPPSDALVPGTSFHATGALPCALAKGQPMMQCRFGVVRQGLGKADVTIFLPGNEIRIIRFENGVPIGSDAPGNPRLSFTKQADLFLISINAVRFEIPEAVINGG